MKNPEIKKFQKKVWDYYTKEGRHDLPWRKTMNPYRILVSEVMLQQTQVDRVVPKYKAFLKLFPTIEALAGAPLSEVLLGWSGLGYNRRALYLKRAALAVVSEHGGKFPKEAAVLEDLPGVGPYTARAVMAFAYNASDVFIETNIRRVFIHEFFPKSKKVTDAKLLPIIERTLDHARPREWYWALMDYGAHIKTEVTNPNRHSAGYTKQSKFEGSVRQLRGAILRECSTGGIFSRKKLLSSYAAKDRLRAERALAGLIKDGLLVESGKNIQIR